MTEEETNEASFAGNLIYDLMLQYFDNNNEAVEKWLSNNNPFLGYATPITLVNNGKHLDVLEYVDKLAARKHLK